MGLRSKIADLLSLRHGLRPRDNPMMQTNKCFQSCPDSKLVLYTMQHHLYLKCCHLATFNLHILITLSGPHEWLKGRYSQDLVQQLPVSERCLVWKDPRLVHKGQIRSLQSCPFEGCPGGPFDLSYPPLLKPGISSTLLSQKLT